MTSHRFPDPSMNRRVDERSALASDLMVDCNANRDSPCSGGDGQRDLIARMRVTQTPITSDTTLDVRRWTVSAFSRLLALAMDVDDTGGPEVFGRASTSHRPPCIGR